MTFTTRVFITGATGFVGRWMLATAPAGVEFYGVGRQGYDNDALAWLEGITHVVHLAPVAPYKMIDYANEHNARLLYCSSGVVYQDHIMTKYRLEKLRWERDCMEECRDLVITRLFTFFGDGLDNDKAITKFKQQARVGKPLQVAKTKTVRSYMHGAEMARQMWRALLKGYNGGIYDIGSRRPVTVRRVAERIAAFTGCEIIEVEMNVPVPYYVPRGYHVPD